MMTRKIDEYVDQVYRHAKGNTQEIQELKLEMKNHLLETVQELQADGITEDQAVQIAKERFGEVTELRNLINQMFERQKNFGKWILSIGTVLLLVTVIAAVFILINGNNQTAEQADIAYNISGIAGDAAELAEADEQKIETLLDQTTYIQESRIYTDSSSADSFYTSSNDASFPASLFSTEYSYGTDENFVVLEITDTRIIGLLLLAIGFTGFIILFSIWFAINRYHAKRNFKR
ncbi:permease prefix domain 1-containing protein [Planococcus kocurii]|nr:permease prefix domain 1-containing protein [Planococcus kocurii]